MKIKYLPIILLLLFLSGCRTLGPAGFWNSFDDDHIVKNIDDEGPWGGYRLICWKNSDRPYKTKDVITFADLNNWEFARTDSLNKQETNSWVADHADLLNLHYRSNYPHINKPGVSITFVDSNWVSVDGNKEKPPIGYALLSADGKQLEVYLSWGE